MDRVDANALLDRVDPNPLLDRVEPNALLDRVDPDRLLDRVDVDRVMDRVDVPGLVEKAGIAEIVAESTGAMAGSVLDVARRQLVAIDLIVERPIYRLSGRDPRKRPPGPPQIVEKHPLIKEGRGQVTGRYAGPVSRVGGVRPRRVHRLLGLHPGQRRAGLDRRQPGAGRPGAVRQPLGRSGRLRHVVLPVLVGRPGADRTDDRQGRPRIAGAAARR